MRTHLVASTTGPDGAQGAAQPRVWPSQVQAVIDREAPAPGDGSGWQPWRVHGGPGTGKTSLVVDAAVARLLSADTDPESILVLASVSYTHLTLPTIYSV